MKWLILIGAVSLAGCKSDETVSGYAKPDTEYRLIEIDGVAFTGRATIQFPEQGRVVGQAPCNRFFATQTMPYPWFELDGIGATRMACPDLALETAYFDALEAMTLAEVSNSTLILSNSTGREMVFTAR